MRSEADSADQSRTPRGCFQVHFEERFPQSTQADTSYDARDDLDMVLLPVRGLRGGKSGGQLVGELYVAEHDPVLRKCRQGSAVPPHNDMDEILERVRQQPVDPAPAAEGQYAGIHDAGGYGILQVQVSNDDRVRLVRVLLHQ